MSAEPIPFWRCQRSERTQVERRLLAALASTFLKGGADAPDLWMHRNRQQFSPRFVPGEFTEPLFPCRTIMIIPYVTHLVEHLQVYLGRGYYVRMANFRWILLKRLSSDRQPLRMLFRTHTIADVKPLEVLARVRASLGEFTWSPFGANCHSVTTWQLRGTRYTMNNPVFGLSLCAMALVAIMTFAIVVLLLHRRKR